MIYMVAVIAIIKKMLIIIVSRIKINYKNLYNHLKK